MFFSKKCHEKGPGDALEVLIVGRRGRVFHLRNLVLALLTNEEYNCGHIWEHQMIYFDKAVVYRKEIILPLSC